MRLILKLLGDENTQIKEAEPCTFESAESSESLGIKVLKYGSYPLQTYLPDSDIDITVLCKKTSDCPLA